MKGLKMELSLRCIHGAKPLLPFLTSRPISRFQPRCQLAHSIGCRDHFPSKHSKMKGARKVNFTTRITSASIQPMTEELVEDKYKDVPTSGDSIRRKVLPSASLVPDDPTVLLTIAGMLQFKPIFLGKVPRQVPCATTSQRCIRTNDVENVGRTSRHHTFFEMLGNFSFGDYFKKEAIKWAWELTTLEYVRVWSASRQSMVSVYEDDDEAFEMWHDEVGVPVERIKRMGEEDNFWTSGVTGPCGPCSELYYDFHPERGHSDVDLGDDTRFVEFYNLVFMQYNRTDDGSLEPLKQKNIDTGLGLERMACILQKVPNNYETDLIFPIIEKASELANVSYVLADDSMKTKVKIIGDHLHAIVYLLSDSVVPSNIGRGYVVRQLIRRAVRTGRLVGIKGDIEEAFLPTIIQTLILEELKREELHFVQTLERGEKLLDQMLADALSSAQENSTAPCLSGKDAFLLYDTYGFPVEITREVADERGVSIDMNSFDIEMENQRRQSQAAHNAVKLEVEDGGDLAENIHDTEFLGYDALSTRAVVEALLVNGKPVLQVSEGSEVEVFLNRTPFYAESGGQIGDNGFLFIPEVGNQQTAVIEIKDVKKSEESIEVGGEVEAAGIASGIRRIEAVAGEAFIEYINARHNYMKQLYSTRKMKAEDVPARVETLLEELRMARNEISAICAKAAVHRASIITNNVLLVGNSKNIKCSRLPSVVDTLEDSAAVILGSCPGEGKVSLITAVSPGVVGMGVQAGKFIGPIAKLCSGGGGGRPNFGQASGRKPENLSSALEKARSELVSILSEKAS
ncbi:hypothetical protein LOK49_LG08G03143 [Camellia lanceoleosa]|uniref:Uncharacterized protein n=1 Tax=Camellia lanceoleosa TaxID=1840588 RepID=A0ACC0GUI8_9ERIC|nr:hypothetical protein LOK49_LG08G03143 [Camellia lanceoleosa]